MILGRVDDDFDFESSVFDAYRRRRRRRRVRRRARRAWASELARARTRLPATPAARSTSWWGRNEPGPFRGSWAGVLAALRRAPRWADRAHCRRRAGDVAAGLGRAVRRCPRRPWSPPTPTSRARTARAVHHRPPGPDQGGRQRPVRRRRGRRRAQPPRHPRRTKRGLQDTLRDRITVEHGRIEVTGLATRIDRPVLRLGALVTYAVSDEESYQERAECVRRRDHGTAAGPSRRRPARWHPAPRAGTTAGGGARRRGDSDVAARSPANRGRGDAAPRRAVGPGIRGAPAGTAQRPQLLRTTRCAHWRSGGPPLRPDRAGCWPPDRQHPGRARPTHGGIDEKFRARHEIRPFRLHVLLVPGWRVPVDVCRGPRRYPFAFDWLPALGPSRRALPPLRRLHTFSASKTRLGCRACLPSAAATAS